MRIDLVIPVTGFLRDVPRVTTDESVTADVSMSPIAHRQRRRRRYTTGYEFTIKDLFR